MNIMYPLLQIYSASLDFSENLLFTSSLQSPSSKLFRFQCFSQPFFPIRTRFSISEGFVGSHRISFGPIALRLVTRHFHSQTFLATILTSSMSDCRSSILVPLRLSSYSSSLYSLQMALFFTQSVYNGAQGSPARWQSTQLAMAMPRIAGMVPRTGTILMRQLSKILQELGLSSCTWLRGRSSFSVCWYEYATLTPLLIPLLVSSLLSLKMSLSYLQSLMSRICSLVGSLFMPAPPDTISLHCFSRQIRITCTFASMLSMQSTTQSGLLSRSSSQFTFFIVTQASTVSIIICGSIRLTYFLMHCTLDVPTSSRTAQLCRFRLLIDTRSKSTTLILPTPDLAIMLTTCDPTPPTPNTTTQEFYSFSNLSSPKNLITLVNCSAFSSLYSESLWYSACSRLAFSLLVAEWLRMDLKCCRSLRATRVASDPMRKGGINFLQSIGDYYTLLCRNFILPISQMQKQQREQSTAFLQWD